MWSFLALWTTMLAFDAGRYVVVAGGAFAVFWVWGRRRFARRRVRAPYPTAADFHREVAYSLSTAAVFASVGTAIYYGERAGVLRFDHHLVAYGWAWFAASIAVLIILQDTYFYWTHRAMHHPRLFRAFHRVHHLSRNPSPWAAYAFAPAEALVHAAYVPLVVLIVPVDGLALFVFLAFMIARNVLGHLGLELFPRGFATARATRWSTTTTHHALHHARPKTNYGLYFTWWDRAMGTTDPTYVTTFDQVATRASTPA